MIKKNVVKKTTTKQQIAFINIFEFHSWDLAHSFSNKNRNINVHPFDGFSVVVSRARACTE